MKRIPRPAPTFEVGTASYPRPVLALTSNNAERSAIRRTGAGTAVPPRTSSSYGRASGSGGQRGWRCAAAGRVTHRTSIACMTVTSGADERGARTGARTGTVA